MNSKIRNGSNGTSRNGTSAHRYSHAVVPYPSPSKDFLLEREVLLAVLNRTCGENFKGCVNISKYERLAKIGQGTFGEVFKARERGTQKFVAMKKILTENEKEGFPITAIREIRILQSLKKHRNIVNLLDVCKSTGQTSPSYTKQLPKYPPLATYYLIFEFCEHDLAGLINNPSVKFSLAEIKMIVKQLLNGLFYLHYNHILHRDMKAANILITKEGVLKVADFGLSRPYSTKRTNRLTNRVVTLWYRPPELLLGDRNYGAPIDMWGAGCIMAELWTRTPIMQGGNEQHQLKIISEFCGPINEDTLPGIDQYELFSKLVLPTGTRRKVKERLRGCVKDENALALIDNLLSINPASRNDADTALCHDFFYTDPLPCEIDKLLAGLSRSQFEYNKRRNILNVQAPHQPTRNDEEYYSVVY